jgi:hypothetical protein
MRRPVEIFDAANRKHRILFAEFMRTGTWGKSPVRLIANQATESDFGTIQRQMVEYYIDREFNQGRVRGFGEKATTFGLPKVVDTKDV